MFIHLLNGAFSAETRRNGVPAPFILDKLHCVTVFFSAGTRRSGDPVPFCLEKGTAFK